MSHSLTKPGGWALNQTMTSAEATDVDEKTRDSVDKTSAGDTVSGVLTFASAAGITMQSGSTLTAANVFTGTFNFESATINIDGSSAISTANGGSIVLANDDYPLLNAGHAGKAKTRRFHLANTNPAGSGGTWITQYNSGLGNQFTHTATVGQGFGFGLNQVHNGATLDSVSVFFSPVADARGGSLAGITMPTINVLRTAAFADNTIPASSVSLSSTGAQTMSTPTYANYVSGSYVFEIPFVCDQNNVIDNTQYNYFVLITDETGGGAVVGNKFWVVEYVFSAIPDLAFQ